MLAAKGRPSLLDCAAAAQQELLRTMHEAERAHLARRLPKTLDTDAVAVDLSLKTNWMRRTRWADMFDGARRNVLVRMSDLPNAFAAELVAVNGT